MPVVRDRGEEPAVEAGVPAGDGPVAALVVERPTRPCAHDGDGRPPLRAEIGHRREGARGSLRLIVGQRFGRFTVRRCPRRGTPRHDHHRGGGWRTRSATSEVLTQRQGVGRVRRRARRDVTRRARRHDREHRPPTMVADLGGLRVVRLGDDGLPPDVDGRHSPVRQAERPLRPAAAVPGRDRHLRRRLGGVRHLAGHDAADPQPCPAGHRGRRPAGARLRHHRRHRVAPPTAGATWRS